jgi:hypothetical protein
MSQGQSLAVADRASSAQSEATVRNALVAYLAILWFLTIVAACLVGLNKHTFRQAYPRDLVFCCRLADFSDFTDFRDRVFHFGEPGMLSSANFVPFPYPVPTIYAFLFFTRLTPRPLGAYLLFVILLFCSATYCLSLRVWRIFPGYVPQVAVWSTLLLCYPLAFLLDRANIEAVVWAFVLLGTAAYVRNRTFASALLWSVAASMKIFPAVLFALFIARRRYGAFVLAAVATAIITLLALAGIGPTIHQAVLDSSRSAAFLREKYILIRYLPQWDHSLFAAAKEAIHRYIMKFGGNEKAAFGSTLRIYNLAFPLAAALLWWFRLRSMPLLNQYMAYLALCILLPYVSFEYTLIYVCLIWGAFLLFLLQDVATGKVALPATTIYIVLACCAGLFGPLSYLYRDSDPIMGGQIKMLILFALLVTVTGYPMPSSLFADLRLPASEPKITV